MTVTARTFDLLGTASFDSIATDIQGTPTDITFDWESPRPASGWVEGSLAAWMTTTSGTSLRIYRSEDVLASPVVWTLQHTYTMNDSTAVTNPRIMTNKFVFGYVFVVWKDNDGVHIGRTQDTGTTWETAVDVTGTATDDTDNVDAQLGVAMTSNRIVVSGHVINSGVKYRLYVSSIFSTLSFSEVTNTPDFLHPFTALDFNSDGTLFAANGQQAPTQIGDNYVFSRTNGVSDHSNISYEVSPLSESKQVNPFVNTGTLPGVTSGLIQGYEAVAEWFGGGTHPSTFVEAIISFTNPISTAEVPLATWSFGSGNNTVPTTFLVELQGSGGAVITSATSAISYDDALTAFSEPLTGISHIRLNQSRTSQSTGITSTFIAGQGEMGSNLLNPTFVGAPTGNPQDVERITTYAITDETIAAQGVVEWTSGARQPVITETLTFDATAHPNGVAIVGAGFATWEPLTKDTTAIGPTLETLYSTTSTVTIKNTSGGAIETLTVNIVPNNNPNRGGIGGNYRWGRLEGVGSIEVKSNPTIALAATLTAQTRSGLPNFKFVGMDDGPPYNGQDIDGTVWRITDFDGAATWVEVTPTNGGAVISPYAMMVDSDGTVAIMTVKSGLSETLTTVDEGANWTTIVSIEEFYRGARKSGSNILLFGDDLLDFSDDNGASVTSVKGDFASKFGSLNARVVKGVLFAE
jgi:hypothetical protein